MADTMPRLDKKILIVSALEDVGDEDAYWLEHTGEERIHAVELMRRMVYGEDRVASGFQRFLEVIELKES